MLIIFKVNYVFIETAPGLFNCARIISINTERARALKSSLLVFETRCRCKLLLLRVYIIITLAQCTITNDE